MRGNKKIKTGMISILLYLLATLLSSCGASNSSTSSDQKAANEKQIFRYPIAVEKDFGTLDPALIQNQEDGYALQMIFTGLVQFDNNGNVKDQLAANHAISADGLTYTFHLRPHLKFSDGAPLTSKDVAYSINRSILPATNSQVSTYLKLIKGYDEVQANKRSTLIDYSLLTPDDNTISILLSKPAAYFLDQLTYPTSYVVEKSLIEKYGTNWTDHLTDGGGDGPFKVKSYIHSQTFHVVPNPNYYGPQPQLKEIDMPFSGTQDTTYKSYLNQQLDWAIVPGADLDTAQKRADFYRANALLIRYISLNFLAKPFNNLEIRQAFALATHKKILAIDITNGAADATNHIVPQGMYGYFPDLKGPDGTTNLTSNQTRAKALLAKGMQEEGYTSVDTLPPITLTSYVGNNVFNNVVNTVVQQWKTILGVTVKVRFIDPNTLNQQESATTGNDSLQAWASGWQADYPDPQDWLNVFFGIRQDYNNNNYGDKRNERTTEEQAVQAELAKADTELDTAKRLSLYNDAEQKLVNDVAWIPLYQQASLVVQNPKLHGYKTNALLITDPDSWANVYFTV